MKTISDDKLEVVRDRWGRPLIGFINGQKPEAYTRCTTYVDCIEDKYNLQKWMQRQVAIGLSEREDLRLAIAAHKDDKRELDRICESAMEAAKASGRATIGTALHALTEQMDSGQEPAGVPAEYVADLEAYRAATQGWKHEHIEQMVVQDKLKVAGTPDRIVKIGNKRYIADLKTGSSIDFGALKIAMQLSMYSISQLYDPGTYSRESHHADRDKGIVIHLPAGSGEAHLYWIDLQAGHFAITIATHVREKRAIKAKDLLEPLDPASLVKPKKATLADQIKALDNPADIRALWSANQNKWTDELTNLASQRVAELQK